MHKKIALIGVCSILGREILNMFAENEYPKECISCVDAHDKIGKEVSFGEQHIFSVDRFESLDFSQIDIFVFCGSVILFKEYSKDPRIANKIIINATIDSNFEDGTHLFVSGINDDAVKNYSKFALPNSTVFQIITALDKVNKDLLISNLVGTVMLPVSYLGNEAMDELFHQTKGVYVNNIPKITKFEHDRIAFNIIPGTGELQEQAKTTYEHEVEQQIKSIFNNINTVDITVMIAPVFIGEISSLTIFTNKDFNEANLAGYFNRENDLGLSYDKNGAYITPKDVVQEDGVFVSRCRYMASEPKKMSLVTTVDNIRTCVVRNLLDLVHLL